MAAPAPPLQPLLVTLFITLCGGEPPALAPRVVSEPAARVAYVASRGVLLACAADGAPPPAISWLADDGATLHDVPSVRRIHSNGSLELLPVPADGAMAPAPATVRCRAANPHGVALSRDVALQPVADGHWEAVVNAPAAAAGGVAVLTCGATAQAQAAYVRPALWYRDDAVLRLDPPSPDARLLAAGRRLLVRGAAPADAGAYSCLARHALTGATRRAPPAILAVTPSPAITAPRLVSADSEVSVPAGHNVCLPCVAPDIKQPHYTWYREMNGRLEPLGVGVDAANSWTWGGGAAACVRRADAAAAGLWVCKAYNELGDATAHVTLTVLDALNVSVTPTVLVAELGSTAHFSCHASLDGAALSWLHDGAAAGAGAELRLRGVARAHRGVYQCVARAGAEVAQAGAELRLADSAPELHYTFIEQALRPGGSVSLRCAASGSPPAHFSWLLDDQPLDQFRTQHRYFISSETSVTGDVVSVLNMSAVTPADGGRYTCRATNALGHAQHSARLNIYGPPTIRALGPVRVVAGANATIYCPYAGYPISSVSWRRGAGAALGASGRVSAVGAALRLAPALAADGGRYECAVVAPLGPAARQQVDVQVRNPPKISPFMFSSELTEGSSVQVLCGVSSGDKPMYFTWLKDDAPLPANLQIEEKSLNEFSLLMFSDLSARHSGAYTCRVSNHAATVNYTANLSVKVAPTWAAEPLDTAVLLGAPLLLQCAAKGQPAPAVTWYKQIGDGSEAAEQWEPVRGAEWGAAGAVSARDGALEAPAAARRHAGLYRCGADNGVGLPLAKHVNVTVHEPAHFESGGGNISSVRGRSAVLTCDSRGDEPIDVTWSRRGQRLDLSSYRWAVSESRTRGGLRSTLTLRAAERGDAGEWRCYAHNQYGRSEQTLYLHVDEPPEAPRHPRLAGVGSRWMRVAWRASAAPARRYSALLTALRAPPGVEEANLTVNSAGGDRIDADGLRSLTARLDGLRPGLAYSLRLTASNHVGQSPHSEPLLFTTLEEVPSASPQNVRVRAANIGELHVSWSPPPLDNWNGELLGYVVSWRELARPDEDEPEEGEGVARAGSAAAPRPTSTELTLAELRPGARYALAVRAYSRAGAGPASPAAYASTAEGAPDRAPRAVACEALSARSLRVRWAPLLAPHVRSYDVQYVAQTAAAHGGVARAGSVGVATLQGLRAATNYSLWVRARADAGPGPPAPPVYCTTAEDVPAAVAGVRALGAALDGVRVAWLAPAARATHYTLYARELGKVGGEWAQRVEAGEGEGEVWRDVRGLRERTVYEFWVRAHAAAGAGPPSRAVSAAPAPPVSVRISSFSRVVPAALGSAARLPCGAVGAGPLRRRWLRPAHAPPADADADTGNLLIHKVELSSGGNYTCEVRGADGTVDTLTMALVVLRTPEASVLRLARATETALALAWDAPADGGAALLGYTLSWARADRPGAARSRALPPDARGRTLAGLACGAPYRVTLRAHNAIGASPHSAPLLTRTRGDKARAPPGTALVWANSTALRLNLLAWAGRCPAGAWAVAVRARGAAAWLPVQVGAETAEATDLRPGTWYEIRVVAHSPAGDTTALYKAATHTINGERLGEAMEVPAEAHGVAGEGGAGPGAPAAPRHAGVAPALLGGGLALLLAMLAGAVAARRATCGARALGRAGAPLAPPAPPAPHAQLYSTEPGKRNGKVLTPPDVASELREISPYATFSMAAGGAGALQLHTFAHAPALALAAPPPRPNLRRAAPEYARGAGGGGGGGGCGGGGGGGRDSDSESSGSPCAACAAELYRLPAAHLSDTLPAVESSADDTSQSARASRGAGGARRGARARRRRDHARHAAPAQPTNRFFTPAPAAGKAGPSP